MKIVVPIPPVDGRAESLVSFNDVGMFTFAVVLSVTVAVAPSTLIEYPSGAFVSSNQYVPSARPLTVRVPLVATKVSVVPSSFASANLYTPSSNLINYNAETVEPSAFTSFFVALYNLNSAPSRTVFPFSAYLVRTILPV